MADSKLSRGSRQLTIFAKEHLVGLDKELNLDSKFNEAVQKVQIYEQNGNAYFAVKAINTLLGTTIKPREKNSKYEEFLHFITREIVTAGGRRTANLLTECGLYKAIFSSRKQGFAYNMQIYITAVLRRLFQKGSVNLEQANEGSKRLVANIQRELAASEKKLKTVNTNFAIYIKGRTSQIKDLENRLSKKSDELQRVESEDPYAKDMLKLYRSQIYLFPARPSQNVLKKSLTMEKYPMDEELTQEAIDDKKFLPELYQFDNWRFWNLKKDLSRKNDLSDIGPYRSYDYDNFDYKKCQKHNPKLRDPETKSEYIDIVKEYYKISSFTRCRNYIIYKFQDQRPSNHFNDCRVNITNRTSNITDNTIIYMDIAAVRYDFLDGEVLDEVKAMVDNFNLEEAKIVKGAYDLEDMKDIMIKTRYEKPKSKKNIVAKERKSKPLRNKHEYVDSDSDW